MVATIYLDADDEITSAAARIRALQDEVVVLVLPVGSRVATSRINFRLLAREAREQGKQLEIVAADASARALAASADLPAHASIGAMEAARAAGGSAAAPPLPRPAVAPPGVGEPPDPHDAPTTVITGLRAGGRARGAPMGNLPGARADRPDPIRRVGPPRRRVAGPAHLAGGAAVVLIVLVGAAIAFAALPSASITLVPSIASVGPLQLSIAAETGVTQPDPSALVVPARRITFDLQAEQTFTATGVKVTDTPATGEVTFSSLDTGASHTIPKGAIVETQAGVKFRTASQVALLPAQIVLVTDPSPHFEIQPSTGSTAIEAVVPGVDGNVLAGAIKIYPATNTPKIITVTNANPTTGGTHTESPVVQQSDIDAALQALDGALDLAFQGRLADPASVPAGTTLFPQTAERGASVPTVDPTTLVGLEQGDFTLGATATGSVVGVDPAPVRVLADARIRSQVPAGFGLVESSIDTEVGEPIVAGGTITFPVAVRAQAIRQVDARALRDQLRGLPLYEARTVLDGLGSATITLWPDWVTTIPSWDARLSLVVEAPAGSTASPAPSAATGSSTGPGSSAVPGATP
jgi:hypothetical protein